MECHKFGLEDFAPELRLQILFHLDSLETLRTLILASASFYQAFVSQKNRILLHFVRQLIRPEVLPDAVAAVNAAHIPPDADKSAIIDFLQSMWKNERVASSEPSLSLEVLVELCRLHKSVDFHMSGIKDRALTVMEKYARAAGTTVQLEVAATPLSVAEITRMQRALYRYQLYCNVFSTRAEKRSIFSAAEQSQYFLERFQAWQIEEIACVYDHLHVLLEDIFDQVEDRFVATLRPSVLSSEQPLVDLLADEVRSQRRTERNATNNSISLSEHSDSDDEQHYSSFWDFEGGFYSHYGKSCGHDYYLEHMLSLGLDFLRNVYEASEDKLLRLVKSNAVLGDGFFSAAIQDDRLFELPNVGIPESGKSEAYDEQESDYDDQENDWALHFRGDRTDEPNDAWLWCFDYERSTYNWRMDDFTFCRSWCYTFWDSQRLNAFGILKIQKSTLMRKLGYQERSRSLEPSAEDRLKLVRAGQSGNRVELKETSLRAAS